jgi:hypothetical protein
MQAEPAEETGIQIAVRLAAKRAGLTTENGGQTALAKMFDPQLTPQAVQKWVAEGIVPDPKKCWEIQGMFPGEVTRFQLNPEVFGEDPMLAAAKGASQKRRTGDAKKMNS